MDKRGQVTVFVIVGVVILIIAILIFYLRSSGTTVLPNIFFTTEAKKEQIEANLHECVEKSVRPAVSLAALQGGDLMPANYRLYKGDKVGYLCLNIPGKEQCLNVMPTLSALVEKLKSNIAVQINNCVDRGLMEGEDVSGSREIKVNMLLEGNAVVVDTDYDVALVKDNVQAPIGKVRTVVSDVPFSELYDVAVTAVNSEAATGDFEQLFYMLQKHGIYEIQVDRPYPDKIFIVNKKDSDFKFQFAIQGEETTGNL